MSKKLGISGEGVSEKGEGVGRKGNRLQSIPNILPNSGLFFQNVNITKHHILIKMTKTADVIA